MDILKRLKKKKEEDSPFSELVKKQPKKKEEPKKDEDIEIKPLHVEHPTATEPPAQATPTKKEEPVFHASGMRELDFDSMADSEDNRALLKEEYIKRMGDLIRDEKIEEAITLLDELNKRLGDKK